MTSLNRKQFYLETIRDLEAKVSVGDFYNIVRASGLVRQLLMDGTSLVDLVRMPHRIKLAFVVMDGPPFPPELEPLFQWLQIDPTFEPSNPNVRALKLDAFLKLKCLSLNGRAFTVYDIITACAHVMGGVHAGYPDAAHQELLDIDEIAKFGGVSASIVSMTAIVRIVLAGLQPLTDAVAQELAEH